MPTKQAVFRWAARIALLAILVLAVCVVAAYAFLGTQSGRDSVARLLEGALSDDQTIVRIARVKGNLASTFRIGEISIADAAGNVIIVEETRLSWRPGSLIRGMVDIEGLDVGRISIAGFAEDTADPGKPSPSAALPPFAMRIATLTVREIFLDAAVIGEAQRLSLTGSLSADGAPLKIAIKARLARLDELPGHANIDVAYTARPAQFKAHVDIEEPAGGPIARLAGFPRGTPLSMQLDGAGPPDAWRGRLTAIAKPLATLTSELAVSVTETGVSLSLDGNTSVAGLLPEAVRSLIAPKIRFEAAIDYASAGALTVKKFTATTEALSAQATARYDTARGTVSATVSLAGGEGLVVPGIAPGVTIAGAKIDAKLDGTMSEPVLAVRVIARHLSAPGVNASGVVGDLMMKVDPEKPIDLSGNLRVDALDTGSAIPAGLLGKALEVQFGGLVRTDGTAPRLDIKLASGAMATEINAAVPRPEIIEGRYILHHNDLAALAAGLGFALNGAADAKGKFRTDLSRDDALFTITGALANVSSPDPWLAALLSPQASVSAEIRWLPDHTLRIAGLDIASASARVQGEATIRPDAGRLDANYTAWVADLGNLSDPAGIPLAGQIQATGTVTGALRTPDITAQIAAHGLSVNGIVLGYIGAGVAARPNASGIQAAVRLGGEISGKPLDGDIDVMIDGATVRLPRLRLALGRNSVAGALTIDTANVRITGDAALTLSHAEDLPAFVSLPAFASGAGVARLAFRSDGVQVLQLDASADKLVLDNGKSGAMSFGGLTAKLSFRDPFAAVTMDGNVRLTDVQAAGATLAKAEMTLKGGRKSLDWALSGDGKWHVPVSLAAAGSLTLSEDDTSLLVKRLDGKVETYAVRLRKPAPLRWSTRAVKAGPVDLAIGDGAVRLTGEGSGEALDIVGEIEALPLALATLVAPRLALAGSLSGKIRLTGAAPLPSIDIALTATGVRPGDLPKEEFDGLSIEASLRQQDQETKVTLKIRGPDDIAADATLQTAALVGLDPPRFLARTDQPISGQVDASTRLAVIDRIVALGDDRLAGDLKAGVRLAGTFAEPEINGVASLSNGAYEGAATGVVIRDAAARIDFKGKEARLVSLTAVDGNGGRLSGSGAFAFTDGGGTDQVTVKLEQFTAIRRPEAEIVASGEITMKGPLDSPAIKGKLTVEKGEFRIPDRLPEEVIELQVVEINLPEGAATAAARVVEPSATRSLPLALDLAIDFPGKTFVRGRGLDSEWKGALAITGPSAKPKIAGKLEVVRGTFAFAGKAFVLKNGAVILSGSDPIEPEIDVTAEANLKMILARVRIDGKISRPSISVTSEPPMPQEDVLAQILFGRTTGQLSAFQAAQLAQTALTLSGSTGGVSVFDSVRQALGVDVLDVETGEGTGVGTSLKAGKYVTENVFLSVTQGAQSGSQKFGVEVEVLPNLSVVSDVSGTDAGNVGVNWKFDY